MACPSASGWTCAGKVVRNRSVTSWMTSDFSVDLTTNISGAGSRKAGIRKVRVLAFPAAAVRGTGTVWKRGAVSGATGVKSRITVAAGGVGVVGDAGDVGSPVEIEPGAISNWNIPLASVVTVSLTTLLPTRARAKNGTAGWSRES